MRCHSCGTDVREGQKFCMECGASLRGVADVTGEVPVVRAGTPPPEEVTRELITVPPPPPPSPPPLVSPTTAADDRTAQLPPTAPLGASRPAPPGSTNATVPMPVTSSSLVLPATRTHELRVIEANEAATHRTAQAPVETAGARTATRTPTAAAPARSFRLKPLLIVALLACGATAVAVLTTVVTIAPPPDGAVPEYAVNDFGTNNTVAGLLAAAAMLLGALVWCGGSRWGAGLVGGAGASLVGWAALVVGAAEWRIDLAGAGADVSRSVGYWALVAVGAFGAVGLVLSFASSGRDRRNGLDPWIAALAAASFVIAAAGPLIPEGGAGWGSNWTGNNPGDLPTLFFVGRFVQLGLLVVCGVFGCLLVRRWGLGLAVGGALAAGWLLVTSATGSTPDPIGPAFDNLPFTPNDPHFEPHAVTTVGFALAGFFALVAVVMALLDSDR